MWRRVVLVLSCVLGGLVMSQVPRLISYQGRLSDSFGNPINGTRNITFRLYTDSTTSTAIWTETHSNVQISNGLYNVMLGSVTPFPSAVDFSRQYWLGVQVGSDPEMTPRYRVGASPYALNIADTIRTNNSKAIVGTFMPDTVAVLGISKGGWQNILSVGMIGTSNRLWFSSGGTWASISGGTRNRDDIVIRHFDGNVGIGTTAPDYTLDVNGSLRLQPISAPAGAPGLIYYDSAENKFKCYQQGGIVNCVSNGVATKIVAASNSQNKQKADYVCDGANDEAEINSAINALPVTGGIVYLLEGTYNIASPITIAKSNVALIGSGKATVLKRMWNSLSSDQGVITVGDGTNAYEGIFISQIQIDGNKGTYTSSYNHGIFFNQKISRSQIKSTWIYNSGGRGIYLYSGDSTNSNSYNIIEGNDVRGNQNGIDLSYSTNNAITGNTVQGNSSIGIGLVYSNNSTITGNTSQGNSTYGLYIRYSNNNTITGNTVQGNSQHGFLLSYSSNNTITGNKIHDNGGTGAYDGIIIVNNSDSNLISSNDITDTQGTGYAINIFSDCDNNYLVGNRYSGTGASSINDAGTGTIYGAQLYGSHLILKPTGNVGIGTRSPGYKLQVGNAGDGTEARANAWNTFSDIRLKTNLTKLTGALDKISQINGYYFNWNVGTDTRRQVGVVAQEIEKVLPEVVSEDSEGIKSVDYGKLSPLLIEAIKELKAENEALKARIEVLEEKLKAGR